MICMKNWKKFEPLEMSEFPPQNHRDWRRNRQTILTTQILHQESMTVNLRLVDFFHFIHLHAFIYNGSKYLFRNVLIQLFSRSMILMVKRRKIFSNSYLFIC